MAKGNFSIGLRRSQEKKEEETEEDMSAEMPFAWPAVSGSGTEARLFGFDPRIPPAFKFEPTDADIVAYYLLPRALGLHNRYEHAVIDANPGSCPPWELLRGHGLEDSHQGFFFVPPRDATARNGGVARVPRSVPAGKEGVPGKWCGQKGTEEWLHLLRPDGRGEVRVKFKKYNLTYYNEDGEEEEEQGGGGGGGKGKGKEKGTATGWVMCEYQLVEPQVNLVLACVKIAERERHELRKKRKAGFGAARMPVVPYPDQPLPGPSSSQFDGQASAAAQISPVPYPDQPGPSSSNYYHQYDGQAAAAAETSSVPYPDQPGPSSSNYYHVDGQAAVAATEMSSLPYPDQPGPSSDYYHQFGGQQAIAAAQMSSVPDPDHLPGPSGGYYHQFDDPATATAAEMPSVPYPDQPGPSCSGYYCDFDDQPAALAQIPSFPYPDQPGPSSSDYCYVDDGQATAGAMSSAPGFVVQENGNHGDDMGEPPVLLSCPGEGMDADVMNQGYDNGNGIKYLIKEEDVTDAYLNLQGYDGDANLNSNNGGSSSATTPRAVL